VADLRQSTTVKEWEPTRVEPEIIAAVRSIREANPSISGGAAQRKLREDYPDIGQGTPVYTVQRLLGWLKRTSDPQLPWRVGATQAEDLELILPALARRLMLTGGLGWLSATEADWIVRIRRAAPDLVTEGVLEVAWVARLHAAQGAEDAPELAALLALHPWRSDVDLAYFERAYLEPHRRLPVTAEIVRIHSLHPLAWRLRTWQRAADAGEQVDLRGALQPHGAHVESHEEADARYARERAFKENPTGAWVSVEGEEDGE
jgi:hypothetical protein